ncbi:MAG: hypothetical protein R3181_12765 [Rubricoccaceae bacterium]|nr:hypothetical protein [Rubricoccaceae bacterium]
MPQTLLAFIALSLVMMLSLHQQRQSLHVQTERIESDVDRATLQAADDHLDALAALPFDEATRNGFVPSPIGLTRIPVLPTGLTARFDSLGLRRALHLPLEAGGVDDLDDLDGRVFERVRPLPDGNLRLRVETVVGYVQESDSETPSATATKLKKVTVRVTPLGLDADPAVLSRLYTCGSACRW